MLHKRGIVSKTFFFSALLIILVTMVSFIILYFAMPGFYEYKKQEVLQNDLNTLTEALKTSETQEDCAALLAAFVDSNNVMVWSFDADQIMLPKMSSPLVSMPNVEIDDDLLNIYYDVTEDKDMRLFTIQLQTDKVQQESTDMEERIKTFISIETTPTISLSGNVGTDLIDSIIVKGTMQPINEAKDVILSLIPYILIISIGIGILLSWTYARQISKPILQISNATIKMKKMEPDAISAIRSEDEVGLLSRNLDDLYASLCKNISSLQGEMDKVNRLERSKTEMMQSASHELKTPIAALSGMLDGMIDQVGVYKDKEKYLLECKEQVEKLSILVVEILTASKADISEEIIKLEHTSVDQLIQYALDDCEVSIRNNNLQVTTNLSSTTIITDPSVLYRVITNLISNAVRHTPVNGDIRIILHNKQLSIENKCTPILDEELLKLFEPFYTRSYSRDKKESGTGLGLFIVKRNLDRLGILYEVASTELGFKINLIL